MAANSNPRTPKFCEHRDPYYDIGWIDNLSALKAYILRQLGAPKICVELTDEQLTDIIGDTLRYFWKYYSQGHREDYLAFELVPGMTHYKICQELEEVVDLELASWLGNVDNLLTPVNNMMVNQFLPYGGGKYVSTCWGTSDYGDILGNWNATLTWLEEAKMDFGRKYRVKYIREQKALSVWPTPKFPERALLRVYKREHFMNLIQDPLFRELLVAKAGWLWTLGMRKYTLQLAGGGQLNGDSLASDFKQDIKDIKERIDLESPVNEIIVG
jgi:hypothetical protein